MPVQDLIPWLNYAVKEWGKNKITVSNNGNASFLSLRSIKQLRGVECRDAINRVSTYQTSIIDADVSTCRAFQACCATNNRSVARS